MGEHSMSQKVCCRLQSWIRLASFITRTNHHCTDVLYLCRLPYAQEASNTAKYTTTFNCIMRTPCNSHNYFALEMEAQQEAKSTV